MTEQVPSKELGGSLTVAAGWPSDASITLHPDGRITFGEGLKPDVAAQLFLDTLQQLWATQAAPEPRPVSVEAEAALTEEQIDSLFDALSHELESSWEYEVVRRWHASLGASQPPPAEQA